MADVFSPAKRSQVMSRIKGKNTKPEILVRKYLHANGIGYKTNMPTLPGRPDLVLSKYKCVIFINGCFWHGHEGCSNFRIPKTRTEWWARKIQTTRERDKLKISLLSEMGWDSIVIWECKIEKAYWETMQNLLESIKIRLTNMKSVT